MRSQICIFLKDQHISIGNPSIQRLSALVCHGYSTKKAHEYGTFAAAITSEINKPFDVHIDVTLINSPKIYAICKWHSLIDLSMNKYPLEM